MGFSKEYPNVPDWVYKDTGYQTGAMVKYQGNIFQAAFWASEPGKGDADHNGWRLYDELYDVASPSPTPVANIIGYLPTWRKQEGFDYTNAQLYRNITHGIIAFLMFSETQLGEFHPDALTAVLGILPDVVTTGQAYGTRILIGLGGATDYGFLNLMTAVGNNPADPLLDKAVQAVTAFVEYNGLDGVDLDLECWWDKNDDPNKDQGGRKTSEGPHPAGRGLAVFAQQLKLAMPEKVVSATLFATSWYGNNYDPTIAEYVDWLGVMTYDLTGSWKQTPVGPHAALLKIRDQKVYLPEQQGPWPKARETASPNADPIEDNPIFSVEDSLWYWSNLFFTNWQGLGQKLPRNKMAAGVPLYGYDFAYGKDPDAQSGQIPPGYQVSRYKDILSHFPDAAIAANANIKMPGSTPRPPFISAPGNYPYAHNIYFETPETAVAKLNFVKTLGLQGVILWELSNDVWEEGKSITMALYKQSGNSTKPPVPATVSNPLTPSIIGISQSVGTFAEEVTQVREPENSPIPYLPLPSLPSLTPYFASVGMPPQDAGVISTSWPAIVEGAKGYRRGDPAAPTQLSSLLDKLMPLIGWLEGQVGQEGIGWMFVPFYQIALLFHITLQLEGITISFPNPNNSPLPGRPQPKGPDNNSDEEQCKRQMDKTADSIDHYTQQLQPLSTKWPGRDLGPITWVIEGGGTGGTGGGAIRLPESNPVYVHLDGGLLPVVGAEVPGIKQIAIKIIPGGENETFMMFEITTQEGCKWAMENLKRILESDPSLQSLFEFLSDPTFGWTLLLREVNGVLRGSWHYEIGDRLFYYVAGPPPPGVPAPIFSLLVFKRGGQIYYQGNMNENIFSQFKEQVGIDPLS